MSAGRSPSLVILSHVFRYPTIDFSPERLANTRSLVLGWELITAQAASKKMRGDAPVFVSASREVCRGRSTSDHRRPSTSPRRQPGQHHQPCGGDSRTINLPRCGCVQGVARPWHPSLIHRQARQVGTVHRAGNRRGSVPPAATRLRPPPWRTALHVIRREAPAQCGSVRFWPITACHQPLPVCRQLPAGRIHRDPATGRSGAGGFNSAVRSRRSRGRSR